MFLVSVIIPVYNCSLYLDACLHSILRQTYKNIEVLVCDDASTDDSYKKLQQYAVNEPRMRLFQNKRNLGVSATRNKLIYEASGKYVMMQDADDYSALDRIQLQVDYLSDNSIYVGCSVQFQKIYNGRIVFTSNYPAHWESIKKGIPVRLPWVCAGLMIKRETLIRYGCYQNIFSKSGFEDQYLLASIALKEPIANLPQVLYFYRYNPKSITKSFHNPDVEKVILNKLGYLLLSQQVSMGTDFLMNKDWSSLQGLLKELRKPYLQDSSLLYRELAEKSWFWNDRLAAVLLALKATRKRPMEIANIKLLLYLIGHFLRPKQLAYEG